MLETIELKMKWQIGSQLDSGGFGKIYMAKADDGSDAVVKLVPKTPGAGRELLFEELTGKPNVLPILDIGEWEDNYVIVMPRAEKSLREHLDSVGGKLEFDKAIIVLIDVIQALGTLDNEVVHRDLKPENVLFYEGHWCLADFGIARYAEASTAPDTRKFAMTRQYAAPEQWRGERVTCATDVYSFGVMAYELLQGQRPFLGPDFREQHLNELAPTVSGCPPMFSSLVNECLYKPQSARPTPANILARLIGLQKPSSPADGRLQEINKTVVEKLAAEQASISAQQSREAIREELFRTAEQSLDNILDALQGRVLAAASATRVSHGGRGNLRLNLQLGDGSLIVDPVKKAPVNSLAAHGYEPPFDVIAYTSIVAHKPRDTYGYEGRSHSLWFCDAYDEGVFRWFELAFMVQALIGDRYSLNPFSMSPEEKDAAGAFAPLLGARQIAWQPVPFDQGDEEQFIQRWLVWFAAVVDGSLQYPSHMPENSGGRFRLPQQPS